MPCSWARDCAVPGGRTPPLEQRRARVGRLQVAYIGVRTCQRRWGEGDGGRGIVEAYIAGIPPDTATAGGRPGRRQQCEWAQACRARVVGIGVRSADAREECG